MGGHDTNDLSLISHGASGRRSWRRLLLAGATCAGMIVILVILWDAWLIRARRGGDDLGNRLPPDALADYLPEDSAAILAVNVRQLLDTPIGRRHLGPHLQPLIQQAERQMPWLNLAGIKPLDDLDTLRISFAPSSGEPLGLVRCRFDSSRFQIGPNKLQEKPLDHFRAWEYNDHSARQTTLIVPVGDTLIVSETRSRVQAALQYALDPQLTPVRDAKLRELLGKVDRRQNLWLAASIRALGPISEIDNSLLKFALRPLLAHAESVYGGIRCGTDLRAELHFITATDEDAAKLETDLQSIREAAPGAALLSRQKDLLPLVHLLAASQIRREGKTILLRCRVTGDQLNK